MGLAGMAAPGADEAWAKSVVQDRVSRGSLDDRKFARAWVDELHRKGLSRRGIVAKLREKGVEAALAHEAIAALDLEVGPAAERMRAVAYARRRRLGPMRPDPAQRAARRQRDLGAMARAGFSFGIALEVVDAEDLEDVLNRC